MSQHTYIATMDDQNVVVTMGYDSPLDYVFCVVMGDDDEPIYSNLDDREAGIDQQDVEYYRHILFRLGIKVPEEMFAEVTLDQANNVGNLQVRHQ